MTKAFASQADLAEKQVTFTKLSARASSSRPPTSTDCTARRPSSVSSAAGCLLWDAGMP